MTMINDKSIQGLFQSLRRNPKSMLRLATGF